MKKWKLYYCLQISPQETLLRHQELLNAKLERNFNEKKKQEKKRIREDIAFNILKIIADREERNRKTVPEVRKETITIKLMIRSS